MGGLSVGVFWGFVVSVLGLAALSLSSPLPPRGEDDAAAVVEAAAVEEAGDGETADAPDAEEATADPDEVAPDAEAGTPEVEEPAGEAEEGAEESAPATEVPLPSGSEFNRPPPEPEAALPAADTAPSVATPQAPALAGDVAAPSLDTTPAAQPSVAADAPAQIAATADAGTAPASPASSPAPVLGSGPAALTQPDASPMPQVSTRVLPQVAVPEADATEAEDPQAVDLPATAALIPDAVDPQPMPLQTPNFPIIGEDAAEAQTPELPSEAPTEDIAALTTPGFPQISAPAEGTASATGLPQMTPAAPVDEAPEAEEAVEDPTPQGDLPAIQAFAAPFDASEERPLMAIVLIDEPDSRIEQSTLTRFTFPVAFAVDPLHPEAAARAAIYREAGFEVVMLGSMIPEGATAADAEVALAAAEVTLPEAVALLDTPEGRIQGDRPVLDAVVEALGASGHGLVAFPRGLNAAEQSASRAGVPGATLFRLLDDEEQRATVITRFLSRAAFTASQEGTVIVAGHTRPDTVTALFSWALGGRSEGVALAPLSATILRAAAP